MLVALFTMLFLGGGSPLMASYDVIHDNVKVEVHDKVRRGQALDVVKRMQGNAKNFQKREALRAKELGELNKTREFDIASADAIWEAWFEDVEAYHAGVLLDREDLKEIVNRDEWSAIFAADAAQ